MATSTHQLREAIESAGGKKKFKEHWKQYRSDSDYLEQNREALLQAYPEQWIAIYKGEVRVVANDPESLIRKIEEKQLVPNVVLISFLSTKEAIALF